MEHSLANTSDLFVELESILKSIASWKRLLILDELVRFEEGLTYTELRKAVESLQGKKSVRIDFHLEELRKISFVKKDKTHSLFKGQGGGKEVYKITYAGRIIHSLVTSLLERQLFFSSPEDGLIFDDSIDFPADLDLTSLVLMLDITKEFERVQYTDGVYLYWIISERIQKYPPLNNLVITFEFAEQSEDQPNHVMSIKAYWNRQAIDSTAEEHGIGREELLKDQKISNGLVFMIQQSLSKVRDLVYDLDASSAKKISDKIFEYIEDRESFLDKIILD